MLKYILYGDFSFTQTHGFFGKRRSFCLSKARSGWVLPLILYPHQHKLLLVLLILVILTGLRWSFKDLSYICLMAKDVKDKVFLSHLSFLFWEFVVLICTSFFNWAICVFEIKFLEYILETLGKNLFLFGRLLLFQNDGALCHAEAF